MGLGTGSCAPKVVTSVLVQKQDIVLVQKQDIVLVHKYGIVLVCKQDMVLVRKQDLALVQQTIVHKQDIVLVQNRTHYSCAKATCIALVQKQAMILFKRKTPLSFTTRHCYSSRTRYCSGSKSRHFCLVEKQHKTIHCSCSTQHTVWWLNKNIVLVWKQYIVLVQAQCIVLVQNKRHWSLILFNKKTRYKLVLPIQLRVKTRVPKSYIGLCTNVVLGRCTEQRAFSTGSLRLEVARMSGGDGT